MHRRRLATPAITLGMSLLPFLVSVSPPGTMAAPTIRPFDLPTSAAAPYRIVLGPDGNLWFTEAGAAKIGRITPQGVITEFPVETRGAVAGDIARGRDGALWFSLGPVGRIGRISTSGRITEVPFGGVQVDNVSAGPDGNIWFTESATDKVWRLDLATKSSTAFSVPTPDSSPLDITAGRDGNLWFSEDDRIGRITPNGTVTELAKASITSSPSRGARTATSGSRSNSPEGSARCHRKGHSCSTGRLGTPSTRSRWARMATCGSRSLPMGGLDGSRPTASPSSPHSSTRASCPGSAVGREGPSGSWGTSPTGSTG